MYAIKLYIFFSSFCNNTPTNTGQLNETFVQSKY